MGHQDIWWPNKHWRGGGHPALAVIMVQYDFKLTVLHYAVMFQPDAVSSAVGLLCFDSVYCKTKQEYPWGLLKLIVFT